MGRCRAEDTYPTAPAVLEKPQEEAATLQMLSLQTILADLFTQGLLHSSQSKRALLAKTCNLSCLMDCMIFNCSGWRGLWWVVPAEAVEGKRQQVGAICSGASTAPCTECDWRARGHLPLLLQVASSWWEKASQSEKQTSDFYCVSHPSGLSCHTERLPWSPAHFCHGGGSWVTLQNPEKVSLPLALHAVYLYTYNDHHSQWRFLWWHPTCYSNTIKYL